MSWLLQYLSGNILALHPPFLAVFCHKHTCCFVMSEPPPGSIGAPPPGIMNAFSLLRAIRYQTTCGTLQGGGEGDFAASLLLSFLVVDGDSSREISTGGVLQTGGVVNNQKYRESSTRSSDVKQQVQMDTLGEDRPMPIALSDSEPQFFNGGPPIDRFSAIQQEEVHPTLLPPAEVRSSLYKD